MDWHPVWEQKYSQSFHAKETKYKHQPDEPLARGRDFTFFVTVTHRESHSQNDAGKICRVITSVELGHIWEHFVEYILSRVWM